MSNGPSQAAREMARRLVAQNVGDLPDSAGAGAAFQRLCTALSDSLRRSMGDDGCAALFERALTAAEMEHAVMRDVRGIGKADSTSLAGVRESVDAYGIAAVTAGIEYMLAFVIDLLSSLIGPDMVLNLLNIDRPTTHESGHRQAE
jgi:hypothetical protein